MAKKKSEAPSLSTVAPSLQDRLAKLKRSVTAVTEGRWGLEDAALVPGQEPERFRRRIYSTGLLSLDGATELGGLPRGMIVEIFGSPSAGKSLLLLNIIASVQRTCNRCYGPLPTASTPCACGGGGGLFVLLDQEGCVSEDTTIVDSRTGEVHSAREIFEGRLPVSPLSYDASPGRVVSKPFTNWIDSGVKPLYEVRTSSTSIKVTANHKFLVHVPGDTELTWRRADQLKPGMLVSRPRAVDHEWSDDGEVTPAEARILGYLIGDGSLCSPSPHFYNVDRDVLDDLSAVLGVYGAHLVSVNDGRDIGYRVVGTRGHRKASKHHRSMVAELCERVGLTGKRAPDKFIPSKIVDGCMDAASELLSGLYLTDGSVSTCRPTMVLGTTSRLIVEQVRLLWSRFGVIARATTHASKNSPRPQYALTINGADSLSETRRVLNLVGYKKDRLDRHCERPYARHGRRHNCKNGHYYPWYYDLKPRVRKSLSEQERAEYVNSSGLYWDEILEVVPAGEGQTYDFTVDDTHNFVANDVVVHNSLDPSWAQAQGVDLDYLLVLKLPTGEQAVDILRSIMSQHHPDGIAIDSIAQLQPKTEQGKSAVDDAQQPGLHAKVMSLLCRHVTSEFLADPQGAPLFLWVNQMRADVSGHGALRVTGGMAPEFYSSFRLYMLKQGAVNQQHPELGRHGRMTIKKCKMSRALEGRTINYVLLPDGFDRATDTYETAVQAGTFLLSALQSGGHYWAEDVEKGEKLASSKQACIDRLKEDQAFHDDVRRRTLSLMGTKPVPLISLGDADQEGNEES